MENITFTHSVLRKHTIDPLEGHTVVVLEQIGDAGEKFRFEIQPEHEPPKASLFRLPWRAQPNYFAYAVTASSLQAQFGADIRMDDLLHKFVMNIRVTYSVSEPRVLVTRRNDDPLKIVRDEIVRLVQGHVATYRWIDITNDFRRVEREVVSDVLAAVRHHAGGCGLRVQDLSLSHDVPPDQIEDKIRNAKHEGEKDKIQKDAELESLKEELEIKRQELHAERAAFRRSGETADAAVRALTTALQNAANSVHNPAELMQTLIGVNALVDDLRRLCIVNDTVPVLYAMRDWIANGGPSTGTLVALLFLHGGIAEKLEELSTNVRAMAGNPVTNPILISLADGDKAVLQFCAFLADLHASINQPFVLPAEVQRNLNENFAECLTTWARGSTANDAFRELVEDVFVSLTNIRNGAMSEDLYRLFASQAFIDDAALRTFSANVRRKCLETAR
jgi:hypothetical protein